MEAKGLISLVIGIFGIIVSIFLKNDQVSSNLVKISIGLIFASFIEICVNLYEHRKRIKVIICTWILKPNKPIRITTAYLFRIEVNGKFLLIRRHKKDRQGYQPVGGTFKYLKDENRELFDNLGIEPCNYVARDSDTENDLRLIMRKRKKLYKYLRWFESRKNRELDPWREFYEELIEPGFIPFSIFPHIQYLFIKKIEELVIPSPAYPIDEFRYAEIYELKFENDSQKEAFISLVNNDIVLHATPDEIRKGTSDNGLTILPHSIKILPS
jgi:hypothetical protein